MAQNLWDQEIDKSVDWGGDSSTGGLPVSGKYVQKFIKDTLEQKYGYFDYDKKNSKYYVFADKHNCELYNSDTTGAYANLLLMTFDAPAPATFKVTVNSPQVITVLKGSTGNVIDFNYFITDSNNQPMSEAVTMRIAFEVNGTRTSISRTLPVNLEEYATEPGVHVSQDISAYLTAEGTYTITVTLTGNQSNATANISLSYTVVALSLESTFSNKAAIGYESNSFGVPYTITGGSGLAKTILIYIDGEIYYQTISGYDSSVAVSSGDSLGTSSPLSGSFNIYMKTAADSQRVKWPELGEPWGAGTFTNEALAGKEVFSPGKHSLQLSCYIPGNGTELIYSLTKYFDFVVGYPASDTGRHTYVMYSANSAEAGQIFDPSEPLQFACEQYTNTSFDVSVYDSMQRTVGINYVLTKENEDGSITNIATLEHSVDTATDNPIDTFNYTFSTHGNVKLEVIETMQNTKQLDVVIIVAKSEAEDVEEYSTNMIVKYTALNRSNGETAKTTWTNSAPAGRTPGYQFPATFNNVLWNSQSGWDGEALVLKNGATVTFPVNMFTRDFYDASGMTFEIELETSDVQDDDATIMDFSDTGINRSYLKINATSATMNTNNNVSLKTNFKDGERIKIAFAFTPLYDKDAVTRQYNESGGNVSTYYNMLFIYVNGVLDRVCKYGNGSAGSDSLAWRGATGPNANSFTIGNTAGAASVKLYSIRIYNSALTPEQAFMNFMADSGSDIINVYKRNDILKDGQISLDIVQQRTRTVIMSMDYTSINNASDKKENTMADMQYIDPDDHELDFYARNIWISCQGTSSMQYPVKNLRPYFGKTPNKKTFQKIETILTDEGSVSAKTASDINLNLTPEFETEFWPGSEYTGYRSDPEEYLENVPPHGCNKKVDGSDGVKHVKFHKIGANRTALGKYNMTMGYAFDGAARRTDIYGKPEIIYKVVDTDADGIMTFAPMTDAELRDLNVNYFVTNDCWISALRPVKRHEFDVGNISDADPMPDADYWALLKQLRYAGAKLFTRKDTKDESGNIVSVKYTECKKNKPLTEGNDYYVDGSWWKQKQESGFTDRWTFKADYAESSNTHNGGTGRLWGAAMKGVTVNGNYVCRTGAQTVAAKIANFPDIRTSCDCVPVVLFTRQLIGFNENTGKKVYDNAKFAGLFNIMTDKGSTKLFGFEDLYDENGTKVFSAKHTQCWECLANGSAIAAGTSLTFDLENDEGTETSLSSGSLGDGRLIWSTYESRWPDSGQERHEGNDAWPDDTYGVESNALESFWQWVNFTKPAINYKVDGIEGYEMNEFVALTSEQAAQYYARYEEACENNNVDNMGENRLYIHWYNANNDDYAAIKLDADGDGKSDTYTANAKDNENDGEEYTATYNPDSVVVYYCHRTNIDYTNVTKEINPQTIGEWMSIAYGNDSDVYVGKVPSWDSNNRCFDADGNNDPEGDEAQQYYVDVYMYYKNQKFNYINNYGQPVVYLRGDIDPETDYLKNNDRSWKNYTFMQFFSKTKYEHLDVYKCAAYYVYIMRFCAVDQVVKNSMMTSEGPTESSNGNYVWYFINYDNDTIFGVRNDGQLKFNWDCDRDTYDSDGNSYSYAGAKSVLWNNLSMDADFMAIVTTVDTRMYEQGLLNVSTVLDLYNNKQEGTWCERMYNEQEKIKYLSTFQKNFSTDKYLLFMHGSRHSHRLWWINHRWELMDAMWNTGSYEQKKFRYYLIINDASAKNPVEYMSITAAAKYYFTSMSNTGGTYRKFKELKANEKYTFYTNTPFAIGDPMIFIGPQKIKVLDFRPGISYLSSQLLLNETYTIMENGKSVPMTWPIEAGCMMTRFLIGDGTHDSAVTNIAGIDDISSLEEVDIRRCKGGQANGGNGISFSTPTISNLANLHRFRASGSTNATFLPAEGCTFYEVSLSDTTTQIVMTNVSFVPCPNDFDDPTVDYTGSETAFKYSKSFDAETNTLVSHDDYTFNSYEETNATAMNEIDTKRTIQHGVSSGDFYVFDYTPNAQLSDLVLYNVKGLDTKQLVLDWYNALVEAHANTDAVNLTMTGIQWTDITVDELIDIYDAFKPTTFSGTIYVTGSDAGGALTQEEYNRLVDKFGENAFKVGSTLVLNASENMFFTPTDLEKYPANINDINGSNPVTGLDDREVYYKVVRGQEFEVNATIFPVSDSNRYIYQLQYRQGTSWLAASLVSGTVYPDTQYEYRVGGVTLTNANGKAVFKAAEGAAGQYPTAPLYRIRVIDVNEDGTPNTNHVWSTDFTPFKYVYLTLSDQIFPQQRYASIVGDTEIIDTDKHEYSVSFGQLHDSFNVNVKSMTVSLSNVSNTMHSNTVTEIDPESIIVDNINKVYKFKLSNTIQAENTVSPVYVKVNFETELADYQTISLTLNLNVRTIYAESISIVDSNNNEVEGQLFLNHTGTTHYTIQITPANYNVKFDNIATDFDNERVQILNQTVNGFDLSIRSNANQDGTYNSFDSGYTPLNITLTPSLNAESHTLTKSISVRGAIVYPARVTLLRDKIIAGQASGTTSSADVNLTDGQGTHNANPYGAVDASTFSKIMGTGGSSSDTYRPIHYDFNITDNTGNSAITENYELRISDVTITNVNGREGEVSVNYSNYLVSDYENESGAIINGHTGFDLTIQAATNQTDDYTVTITGTVSSDYDDLDDTKGEYTLPFTLTFKVSRSVSAASSYTDLREGVVYAMDEDGRFYTTEFNADGTPTVAANSIYLSGITGDGWKAVCMVTNVRSGGRDVLVPLCIGLKELRDDENTTMNYWVVDNLPSVNSSDETLYNGFENTKYLYENVVATSSEPIASVEQSVLYKAWNMFDNYSGYIPSYAETLYIVNNYQAINAMINYLANSFGTDADVINPTGTKESGDLLIDVYFTSTTNTASVIGVRRNYNTGNAEVSTERRAYRLTSGDGDSSFVTRVLMKLD